MQGNHPVLTGWTVGCIEICLTHPLEFVKRTLQLQQQASALHRAASITYSSPLECVVHTVRMHGVRGLYCGFKPFMILAGPRSAIRWSAYDALSSAMRRRSDAHPVVREGVCGFGAGIVEAALGQTPTQAISTKLLHDQSPAGPSRYRGLLHALRLIHAEHGFWRGFFCGIEPAVIKGAATNALRFPIYGALKRVVQRADETPRPLPPAHALLCGAAAGAASAVATQPIDTVMAQAQGLESARFRNSLHCAREIVATGGVRALYFGLGPRCLRVCAEVGLQFSLFEQISPLFDRWLDER